MERTVQKVKFPPRQPKLKRVAAYARVSSGKDAMLHSLAAQVEYYSNYIRRHPGWEYVGVYADEAKTGTKDSREQFQQLLTDCKTGKIDHIVTKSISRMARNTVTLLETVRELKAVGITVYFEEQNIDTGTDDGELMLSILASYAQEESLSASENQKWRVRQNFENGQPWRGFMASGSSPGAVSASAVTGARPSMTALSSAATAWRTRVPRRASGNWWKRSPRTIWP